MAMLGLFPQALWVAKAVTVTLAALRRNKLHVPPRFKKTSTSGHVFLQNHELAGLGSNTSSHITGKGLL